MLVTVKLPKELRRPSPASAQGSLALPGQGVSRSLAQRWEGQRACTHTPSASHHYANVPLHWLTKALPRCCPGLRPRPEEGRDGPSADMVCSAQPATLSPAFPSLTAPEN